MSELDVRPEPDVVSPGEQEVTVHVVNGSGDPMANATVIAKSASARLSGLQTAEAGVNGTATLSIDLRLGPNRAQWTITLDVKSSSGGYTNRQENTAILVLC